MHNVMSRHLLLPLLILLLLLTAGCPHPPPVPPRPPVVPKHPVQGISYTIQSGDTVYSIAQKFGVHWGAIIDANPNLDPRKLAVGSKLIIPGAQSVPPAPPKAGPTRPARNPGHAGPITAEATYAWPLKGEVFGRFRAPMSWRAGELNNGIDIRAEKDQVVLAARSGKVNTFTDVPGLGQVVLIEHTDGSSALYGHLSDILVTHGTWVKQGENIGIAGNTGQSNGLELHFRIWRGSQFVNPLTFLPR